MPIPEREEHGEFLEHNQEQYHAPCPECGAPRIHCPCCDEAMSAWHVCSECDWEEFDEEVDAEEA